MKTSEETKHGPSVVAETLKSLAGQAKLCHDKIDQLEAAQSINRGEIIAEVGKLLDLCQNLRDAILSEDSTAAWKTKSELTTLVSRLDDAAAKRRRYLELAQFLATGTISHRRERTRQERLALRDAAVSELMEISERATPPELPGPEAENWLGWACGLEDETNDAELQQLKSGFPRLDDFVRQLEIDWWRNGPESAPRAAAKPAPKPASAPAKIESNGSHFGNGNGNGSYKEPAIAPIAEPVIHAAEQEPIQLHTPVMPEPVVQSAPVPAPVPVPVPVQEIAIEEPKIAAPEPDDFPALHVSSDSHEEELPAGSLIPSRNGKISFFSWDQVDQFTSHIERANIERKDARTVRALLAVSQWLEPKDHNPLSHPKCGIRALTGHPAITDFEWISPNDVMQAIAMDDGLPMLTGGADLLRWGLLQPSERNFQGIASIRRFSRDHIKAWFSDIYRIALSDKQIDDIYTLTSGIPLLVSEMHKLIIPQPEDPPTWLGLARWIEIKGLFEKQIPTVAHELKKGTPAVRLTDREISLLNMVVTVSADSEPETIVANLSQNWEKYQHPEYRPFSSRDEVSLAVLLELGLLPKRNVVGVEPSRALLPLKQDDAIRHIVEHL
ncbi:hypothetical protein [Occallatibacter savannae]|uniref:hypothetical protein n=1 Tax=Occallatibacter savannae TaxID=1002691 RepID=UPI000D692B3D|nr:hypothetical protein [Occallatibacter savannae]